MGMVFHRNGEFIKKEYRYRLIEDVDKSIRKGFVRECLLVLENVH